MSRLKTFCGRLLLKSTAKGFQIILFFLLVSIIFSSHFCILTQGSPLSYGCLCPSSSILWVSLPDGENRTKICDPDPWLSECWLLNITGASGTFTLNITNVSGAITSYDTHLIVALNKEAYNNLISLHVNDTNVPKTAFMCGTPTPYNIWTWPSGNVYPTWFNDTIINVGTILPKEPVSVILDVSVTFSNVSGVRMHFDAYGKKSCAAPRTPGNLTANSLSHDSTVLFSPSATPPSGHAVGWCWLASAVYGSADALKLDTLRAFRDRILLSNPLGCLFVSSYYSSAPPIAQQIEANPLLRNTVRFTFIEPIYGFASFVLSPYFPALCLIFILAEAILLAKKPKAAKLTFLILGNTLLYLAAFSTLIFSLGYLGYTSPTSAFLAACLTPTFIPGLILWNWIIHRKTKRASDRSIDNDRAKEK